eukprot:gene43873-58481_t
MGRAEGRLPALHSGPCRLKCLYRFVDKLVFPRVCHGHARAQSAFWRFHPHGNLFMSISHARVAVRLALAFGVVCLVMSLSAAVGIWRLAGLQDIADDLGGVSSERALLARELHAIVVLSSARAET